ICQNAEDECFRKTGTLVKLSKTTLARRVAGTKSIRESNAARGWLTEEETEAVLTFATELANRGFPLSHARIKEHVDEICRARYGAEFPSGGVGQQWTHRFVTKHSERL
ncbi:hypothetical protein OBBRIDRAFT_693204, partial [Obba rivulosa]